MTEPLEFKEFGKIHRLYRQVIVTEKIDGTNACVIVDADGRVGAQSRSRVITPLDDNAGFAAWVFAHEEELRGLGPGHHFGEWWGRSIQRNYGLAERRFSLFNVHRWGETRPACCHVVPVLFAGDAHYGFDIVKVALDGLRACGSVAAQGFMRPEGVVAYHTQADALFKVTLERDDEPKGKP
jgi:hypothetical protein